MTSLFCVFGYHHMICWLLSLVNACSAVPKWVIFVTYLQTESCIANHSLRHFSCHCAGMLNSAKGKEGVWHGFEWVRVICGALFWVFSSSVSRQQAVVFLCQRRNMRAVSGDPRCVSVSGKGPSPSVRCLCCRAVAGSETWHASSQGCKQCSSEPQGWQHC